MAAYWEIAAQSACDMFPSIVNMVKYLLVNLVFPNSVFVVGISF